MFPAVYYIGSARGLLFNTTFMCFKDMILWITSNMHHFIFEDIKQDSNSHFTHVLILKDGLVKSITHSV